MYEFSLHPNTYVNEKPKEVQIKTILDSKRLLFCDNDTMEYYSLPSMVCGSFGPICLICLPARKHPLCPCFTCPLKLDVTLSPSSTSWFNLTENIYHINGTRGWYEHNLHQGATWRDQRHQFGHLGANSSRFISQICHQLAGSSRAPSQNLIFICKWIAYICKFKKLKETMYIKGLARTLAYKPIVIVESSD